MFHCWMAGIAPGLIVTPQFQHRPLAQPSPSLSPSIAREGRAPKARSKQSRA